MTFRQLRLDRQLIPTPAPGSLEAKLLQRADDLITQCETGPLQWDVIWDVEATLLQIVPEAALRHRIRSLRDEYERLATADTFANFMKGNPPNPVSATPVDLRAHAKDLGDDVQRLRVGRGVLLTIRWLHMVAMLVVFTPLLAWAATRAETENIRLMPVVIVAALGGSVLSITSRLFAIPVKGDLIERSHNQGQRIVWGLSPFMSMAEGVIAGLVMYLILQSALLQSVVSGPIFPEFVRLPTNVRPFDPTTRPAPTTQEDPQPKSGEAVHEFGYSWTWWFIAIPKDSSQLAKLMVWCILAGFAERLVPDTLSQIAAKAAAKEAKNA